MPEPRITSYNVCYTKLLRFGRRDQKELFTFGLEKIFFEFRKLPRAFERAAVDQSGNADFGESAFAVEVKHKIDEGAFETCPHIVGDAETAFGDFYPAFKVDPAVLLGKFPVLFGSKGKGPGCQDFGDLDIVIFIFSVGNVIVRRA